MLSNMMLLFTARSWKQTSKQTDKNALGKLNSTMRDVDHSTDGERERNGHAAHPI